MDPRIERARAGDPVAMEELLASVAPTIHRFGRRMCKNPSDADDVLQDTLLAVATHLPEFEGRSSLSSWVFMLARTACSRRRRGLKNQAHVGEEALDDQADEAQSPEATAAERELSRALERALHALPDDYREVLFLRDMEGLSAAEAASSLGVSVDALKSRLHRARAALRESLRPTLEPMRPAPSAACPDVAALWSRHLEGDLDQQDCAAMEKHVASCPSCGSACASLRAALLACQRVTTVAVPPEVQARVKAALLAFQTQPRG